MKIIYITILASAFVLAIVFSLTMPDTIISNKFIRGFINHEILNIQGVILAITLASIASLHIAFNNIEERVKGTDLSDARQEIRHDAWGLILSFVFTLGLVFFRDYLEGSPKWAAFIDQFTLWWLLFSILILVDIVDTVFELPAIKRGDQK